MKQSAGSLAVDFAVTLLPTMQMMLEKVRDEIIPTLKEWINKWNNLDSGTKNLILTLGTVVTAIGPVPSIIGKVGPILNMISFGLKGVGTSGFFAGAGINFATLGIGALIAILATALLSSEEFRSLLARLGDTLMKLLMPLMDIVVVLMDALAPVFEVTIDLIVMLVDMLVPIINVILEPFIYQIEFIAEILKALSPLLTLIGEILQAVLVPAIKLLQFVLEPVMKLVEGIVNFLETIFNWIGSLGSKKEGVGVNFSDMLGGITGNLSDFTTNIMTNIGDFINNTVTGISGFIGNIGSGIGDVLGNITNFIGGIGDVFKSRKAYWKIVIV